MRVRYILLLHSLFITILAIFLVACGGGGGGKPTPPAISVSLAPSAQSTIDQGQTVSFIATIANDSASKGVTWSVSGTACSADACGTLTNTTATGATYNAPASVTANLSVSVKATSVSDTSKSATATVVVTPPPSITTTSLADGSVGTAYSATLQASGGAGTLHWSISSGTLPTGLSLNASTGVISGTPSSAATSDFTAEVTDSGSPAVSAEQPLSITINAASTACGSGNESVMNGDYAFMLTGYDASGFRAYIVAVTANGSGSLQNGWVFEAMTDQAFSSTPVFGTYSIGSDNRGCASFTMGPTALTLRFALGSISAGVATKGRVIQFETPAGTAYIGAGGIWLRDPATFSTPLSGNYVFASAGIDTSLARLGFAGTLTISTGNVTDGEVDINDNGTLSHATGVTGQVAGEAPGLGEYDYVLNNVPWGTMLYISALKISDSEAIFYSAKATGPPAVLGTIGQQSGTFSNASLNGTSAFYMSGLPYSGPGGRVEFGLADADGIGSLTATDYDNEAGAWDTPNPGIVTCSYSVASNGRTTLGGSCAGSLVLYLTAPNKAFMLNLDQGVEVGQLEPQVGGPFSAASVSGTYFMGTQAVTSQGTRAEVGSVTLDGAGNVSGVSDGTTTTDQNANDSFTDTYTVNSDGTFLIGSAGTDVVGVVISGDKLVVISDPTSTNPTLLLIEK